LIRKWDYLTALAVNVGSVDLWSLANWFVDLIWVPYGVGGPSGGTWLEEGAPQALRLILREDNADLLDIAITSLVNEAKNASRCSKPLSAIC
jgi:hypothetical protein